MVMVTALSGERDCRERVKRGDKQGLSMREENLEEKQVERDFAGRGSSHWMRVLSTLSRAFHGSP